MIYLKSVLIVVMAAFFAFVEAEAQSTKSEQLKKVLSRSGLSQDDLGLMIQTDKGDEVFNINGKKLFIPASVSKIPTGIAALETFTPGHRFSTQVWAEGEIKNGILKGHLILKGLGEPALISERMWYLANALTRRNIQTVTGDLIVDESYFDSIRYDKDRLPMSEGRAFDAPVSALSFNWNSANIFIRPTRPGQAAEVNIDPVNSYIGEISNNTRTVSSGSQTVNATPSPIKQGQNIVGDKISAQGQISAGSKEVVLYRSISEPDLWAGANFKEFLKQRQIVVQGQIKRGRVSSSAQLLLDEPGSAVRENVNDMMKYSNNFIAEMLAKHLSIEAGAKPGNLSDGVEVIRKTIEKAGIERKDYSFVSPSGLSIKNKLSPAQLNLVLMYGAKSPIGPEFLSSLPIAGVDGTIKSRMKGLNIRAKTGLLSGVSSLAGFASRKDGGSYTFSFIYNGPKHFVAKDLFDDLLMELLK